MLYYDRTDISEVVNNKSMIFITIGFLLNCNFKFLSNFCNSCHGLLTRSVALEILVFQLAKMNL